MKHWSKNSFHELCEAKSFLHLLWTEYSKVTSSEKLVRQPKSGIAARDEAVEYTKGIQSEMGSAGNSASATPAPALSVPHQAPASRNTEAARSPEAAEESSAMEPKPECQRCSNLRRVPNIPADALCQNCTSAHTDVIAFCSGSKWSSSKCWIAHWRQPLHPSY